MDDMSMCRRKESRQIKIIRFGREYSIRKIKIRLELI